jgi:predicted unusual protein kinase regulating ubiquinone biosynthesis (AarF/ABC1/UbiB family)
MNQTQDEIAESKLHRAVKLAGTGAKIGSNYLKYYAKKLVHGTTSKEELHEANAKDVYQTLSELKGSALKVAQMLSMDHNVLPKAYAERFTMAQYQAPPMSAPLVIQTFLKSFGNSPSQIFDKFNPNAVAAASIGQVHLAEKNGKKLAVKIQYPGVANAIQSDLRLVKPIAARMFDISTAEFEKYIIEVESKLLEECNYELELKNGNSIISALKNRLPEIQFPNYYKEYSNDKILVMDWLDGLHLDKFSEKNVNQETKNKIAQSLWDFFNIQVHELHQLHADPHPGNFLFHEDGKLGVLDFGCVKSFTTQFYQRYFVLMVPEIIENKENLYQIMHDVEILLEDDDENLKQIIYNAFEKMVKLLAQPFYHDTFHFGNEDYMQQIYRLGEEISLIPELRQTKKARGLKDALYINRSYFGLYSILHQLNASVSINAKQYADLLKNKFYAHA